MRRSCHDEWHRTERGELNQSGVCGTRTHAHVVVIVSQPQLDRPAVGYPELWEAKLNVYFRVQAIFILITAKSQVPVIWKLELLYLNDNSVVALGYSVYDYQSPTGPECHGIIDQSYLKASSTSRGAQLVSTSTLTYRFV